MSVEYLDLADYVNIAAEVTGLDLATVMKVTNLDLADSALHAPAAGFGDADFYPDFIDKAAVLMVRLTTSTMPGWGHGPSPVDGWCPKLRPLTRLGACRVASRRLVPRTSSVRPIALTALGCTR